jgi:peptide deformylase
MEIPITLEIVTYPHPTLRHRSRVIRRVDRQLRDLVREMFAAMYASKGVGLAANQVNLPLRLFVVNLEGDPASGEEMVFINPVINRPRGSNQAEEGCLSIPGVYGQVSRPKQVRVQAYSLAGEEFTADVDGMLSRVVQHELDHLDGVLFPDRMTETARMALKATLDEFESEFESRRSVGQIPDDLEIRAELASWEERYC